MLRRERTKPIPAKPRFVGSHRHDIDSRPTGTRGNFHHWKRFSGMRFGGYERCYTVVYESGQTQLTENFLHINPNAVYIRTANNEWIKPDFRENGNLFGSIDDIPYRLPVPELDWYWSKLYWVNWDAVDLDAMRTAILGERSDVLQRIENARIKYWMVDNQPEWYTAISQWRSDLGQASTTYSYAVAHMTRLVNFLKSIWNVPVFANVYNGYAGFSAALACFDGLLFESFYWQHTGDVYNPNEYDNATARVTGAPFQVVARRVLQARKRKKLLMFRVPQMRRPEIPILYKLVRRFADALFCEHRYTPTGRHISPSSVFSRDGFYIHPAPPPP